VDDSRKSIECEVPKEAQYLRVIVMEMASNYRSWYLYFGSRYWCIPDFFMFSIQRKIYEIYEEICGARLTTNGKNWRFERDWTTQSL
jgi:NADH-quinone oxidoreductase subunit D